MEINCCCCCCFDLVKYALRFSLDFLFAIYITDISMNLNLTQLTAINIRLLDSTIVIKSKRIRDENGSRKKKRKYRSYHHAFDSYQLVKIVRGYSGVNLNLMNFDDNYYSFIQIEYSMYSTIVNFNMKLTELSDK